LPVESALARPGNGFRADEASRKCRRITSGWRRRLHRKYLQFFAFACNGDIPHDHKQGCERMLHASAVLSSANSTRYTTRIIDGSPSGRVSYIPRKASGRTIYTWRQKFGALEPADMKWLLAARSRDVKPNFQVYGARKV
jgi:hypothetical protein